MSTATAITAEDAEVQAAEARAKIGELETFLADYDRALQEATRDEIRGGKSGRVRGLQRTRAVAEAELPALRGRVLGLDEITAEHAAEVAAQRRAERLAKASELDTQEREAIAEMVAAYRVFADKADAWFGVRSARQSFRLANPVDLDGYPESALNVIDMTGLPRTVKHAQEAIHRAIFESGQVGDVRHLNGWDRFV
jgi:hypothetical protein